MAASRLQFGAVALAVSLACDSGPPPPFSVHDGFLRDADGRALILHGANMSGHDKVAPYLDYQQAPDIARMRDEWGMNSMRLVTVWAAIEPQRGVFDDAYLSALEERVAWAEAADIYVIVDMHQDLYGEGFAGGDGAPAWTCDPARYAAFVPTDPWFFGNLDPNVEACVDDFYRNEATLTEFTATWQRLAVKLSTHANVIGFDPLNEPGWGSAALNAYEADILMPFYVRVVEAVRAVAPQWIAFVEPGASRNLGYPTGLTKFDFPNVMYAPHSYDANAEQGQAFDPSHRAAILSNATALKSEADMLGAGLWVGEYGGPSSLPGITDYLGDEVDAFGTVGAGATIWNYGRQDGGYDILNTDGSEKPDVLAVVTRPYPQKVAGNSVQYTWDAAGKTLTVTYTPNRGISAPTLIAVPPAFRPVSVSCGDCTSDLGEPGVRILTPPSGDVASIVVH